LLFIEGREALFLVGVHPTFLSTTPTWKAVDFGAHDVVAEVVLLVVVSLVFATTMGRSLDIDSTAVAPESNDTTSWVDYWVDNTNYCAFFGEAEDQHSVPETRNGCCGVSNCCLGDSDRNDHPISILPDGYSKARMSQTFRMSSITDDGLDRDLLDDFASQHDAFLDCLLHEQREQLMRASSARSLSSGNNGLEERLRTSDSTGNSGSNSSVPSISITHSWTLSPTSSNDSQSDSGVESSSKSNHSLPRKRRRGLLLVATPRIGNPSSFGTIPQQEKPPLSGSGSRSPTVLRSNSERALRSSKSSSLSTSGSSSALGTKSPESFLHPAVRLQKDKGKGSEVGSEICAKGIPACVGKLRQKMQLLTEHCCVHTSDGVGKGTAIVATSTGAVASMKRRNAIVSEHHPNFVETRSLLTIRMGFLSMSYGILLRWDTGKTGLVTVVVLRKNCHDSFYKRTTIVQNPRVSFPSSRLSMTSATSSGSLRRSPTPNSISPDTSMDDEDDEIVRLNQSPFLIPRPPVFSPSEIIVSVLYATGLNKKSHWTVQLQLGDQIENILLSHDGTFMTPKLGGPLRYTMPSSSSAVKSSCPTITSGAIDAVLEIRLLEHKVRRKTRVLRCSMVLPLSSLEAVGSSTASNTAPTSALAPTQLRIPCPDGGAIQLEASLVSDEAIWQREELAARQHQQEQRLWWKKSDTAHSPVTVMDTERSSNSGVSSWDWLCCALC
jgi:hypothetical protein